MYITWSWHHRCLGKRKLTRSKSLTRMRAGFTPCVVVRTVLKIKIFRHRQFSFENEKHLVLIRNQVEKHWWGCAKPLYFSQTFSRPQQLLIWPVFSLYLGSGYARIETANNFTHFYPLLLHHLSGSINVKLSGRRGAIVIVVQF